MATDIAKNKVTKTPLVLWFISMIIGDKPIPSIDPKETYLVIATIMIKNPRHVNAIIGFIPSIEPNEVATPFPPLTQEIQGNYAQAQQQLPLSRRM